MELKPIIEDLLHIVNPFYVEKIDKNEAKKEVHIHIGISTDYRPEGFENFRIHSHKDRSWEHLNLFEYRCFLHGKLPMYEDKTTKAYKQLEVNFSREHSRFTILYELRVMELMQIHHCFTKVAEQLKINTQRVEKIYHDYTTHLNQNNSLINSKKIGFDETSTKKGHNYITTFVDMETHEILAIEDGKSGEAVELFAAQHENPMNVTEISIDMSAAFISAAKKEFSNANITFDKWHVIKLLYKHLDDFKATMANVHDSLVLSIEKIESFFNQKQAEKGKSQLIFMADFAADKVGDNPFSRTIYRYYEGIVQYFSSKLTNGVLEGINSSIQTIKRVAKGFRYVENFKKMIRFVFAKEPILQPKS
jgi:transposase